ncbi:hypothetical protein BJY59DRAFT_148779 [Rhodotorula toruloides]
MERRRRAVGPPSRGTHSAGLSSPSLFLLQIPSYSHAGCTWTLAMLQTCRRRTDAAFLPALPSLARSSRLPLSTPTTAYPSVPPSWTSLFSCGRTHCDAATATGWRLTSFCLKKRGRSGGTSGGSLNDKDGYRDDCERRLRLDLCCWTFLTRRRNTIRGRLHGITTRRCKGRFVDNPPDPRQLARVAFSCARGCRSGASGTSCDILVTPLHNSAEDRRQTCRPVCLSRAKPRSNR